ncbi:ornithine cyclodeaminase family protein [Chthonobacter rhizosphaerae]|uniref:ornithine cyclodeaminase family protein n=1 Tax=Chthonobacter rhizosphaerae TaxID=2735553 RepID=UPI0015EEA346|nr:ornithine cyclodeaminase family protein [Chthonobacter rhizosphaerae]
MRIYTAAEVAAALPPDALVDTLRAAFRSRIETPLRHHHTIDRGADAAATLLLMPAWHREGRGGYIGTKLVSVFPDNGRRGLPAVNGVYVLMAGDTGEPLAVLDGKEITVRRTAAASALAADYLARRDARHLLMIGAGAMAPHLVAAHAAVRPIDTVTVWARDRAKAEAFAAGIPAVLRDRTVAVHIADDIDDAVGAADIVSAATLSETPLVRGARLRPGTHVDLVGGFTPTMREADDTAVVRSSVFVDTRAGACHEAGDIVQPLRDGVLTDAAIRADLFDLCAGRHGGRADDGEITLFKSVGTALEDLAAAVHVLEAR